MNKLVAHLKRLGACGEAVEWIATQQSLEQAWLDCKNGVWLAWYIFRIGIAGKPWSEKRKSFVLAMCKCARLVQKYVPKDEKRPMRCIKTHEAWVRDEASIEDCKEAAGAAGAAAWVAGAAGAAAWAAGEAGAAGAAVWAAGAAVWAAGAAAGAAGDIARKKTLARCADIVREYYPVLPRRKA